MGKYEFEIFGAFTLLVTVLFFAYIFIENERLSKIKDEADALGERQHELFLKAHDALAKGDFDLAKEYNRQCKAAIDSSKKFLEKQKKLTVD